MVTIVARRRSRSPALRSFARLRLLASAKVIHPRTDFSFFLPFFAFALPSCAIVRGVRPWTKIPRPSMPGFTSWPTTLSTLDEASTSARDLASRSYLPHIKGGVGRGASSLINPKVRGGHTW